MENIEIFRRIDDWPNTIIDLSTQFTTEMFDTLSMYDYSTILRRTRFDSIIITIAELDGNTKR